MAELSQQVFWLIKMAHETMIMFTNAVYLLPSPNPIFAWTGLWFHVPISVISIISVSCQHVPCGWSWLRLQIANSLLRNPILYESWVSWEDLWRVIAYDSPHTARCWVWGQWGHANTWLWGTTHSITCTLMLVTLIARFMGPTWGPSGADRTQVGPMLVPWTLLSGKGKMRLMPSHYLNQCWHIVDWTIRNRSVKSEISIEIHTLSSKKMHLKMLQNGSHFVSISMC